MTAPIKPCPFCGCKPSHNDGGNSRYGRFWWRVGCVNCGVFFDDEEKWDAKSPGNLDQSYHPKQCFEVWNTRADAPELVALVAAARAVNHDSTHGNGLEGFRKNRDRLRIALDQWDALQ